MLHVGATTCLAGGRVAELPAGCQAALWLCHCCCGGGGGARTSGASSDVGMSHSAIGVCMAGASQLARGCNARASAQAVAVDSGSAPPGSRPPDCLPPGGHRAGGRVAGGCCCCCCCYCLPGCQAGLAGWRRPRPLGPPLHRCAGRGARADCRKP